MNLEDITENLFKAAIVGGCAYAVAKDTPNNSICATALAGYTISNSYLFGLVEKGMREMAEKAFPDDIKKVEDLTTKSKLCMVRIKSSLLGVGVASGAYMSLCNLGENSPLMAAWSLVSMGYCGNFRQNIRQIKEIYLDKE